MKRANTLLQNSFNTKVVISQGTYDNISRLKFRQFKTISSDDTFLWNVGGDEQKSNCFVLTKSLISETANAMCGSGIVICWNEKQTSALHTEFTVHSTKLNSKNENNSEIIFNC